MRVDVNANVTVKNHEGVISFGSVKWVEGQVIQIQSESYLKQGRSCELRLELTGTDETIYAEAEVVSVTSSSSAVARIKDIADADRDRLRSWVEEISASVSGLRSVSVSRCGSSASVSTVIGRHSGREALRQALRQSVHQRRETRPQPQEPRTEPQITTRDGRVTVSWRTREALTRDIQSQLRHGRFTLPSTPPSAQITLRLALPDGQILAMPASVAPAAYGCVLRFRMGLPLKQKLKRAARAG